MENLSEKIRGKNNFYGREMGVNTNNYYEYMPKVRDPIITSH